MSYYAAVTFITFSLSLVYAGDSASSEAADPVESSVPGIVPFPATAILPAPIEPRVQPKTPVYRIEVEDQSFAWLPALQQSFMFLSFQHTARMVQGKTRREFGGRFFSDWGKSIGGVNGWGDGDSIITNYIGHPMQGAASGYFQIHNDPRGKYLEFENTSTYWKSRLKAMAWSAAYSTQFEIGPLSEATIGNVGMRPGTSGYVDFVVTPTWGMGFIVAEDLVEKYLIRKLESRSASSNRIRVYRTFLTPQKSFANVLRGRWPWFRDGRPVPERP